MEPLLPDRAVTFSEAVRFAWRGRTRWRGRATRAEYWWWILVAVPLTIGCSVVGTGVGGVLVAVVPSALAPIAGLLPFLLVYGLLIAVVVIPTVSLTVRRVHDLNRSAWWVGSLLILVVVQTAIQVATVMSVFSEPTSVETDSLAVVSEPNSTAVTLGLLYLPVTLAYSVLGLIVFVFTLLPSKAVATRWDGGFRPTRDLGILTSAGVPWQGAPAPGRSASMGASPTAPTWAPPGAPHPTAFVNPGDSQESQGYSSFQAPPPVTPPAAPTGPCRLPNGNLLVHGDESGSTLVEIGPEHPAYAQWAAFIDSQRP